MRQRILICNFKHTHTHAHIQNTPTHTHTRTHLSALKSNQLNSCFFSLFEYVCLHARARMLPLQAVIQLDTHLLTEKPLDIFHVMLLYFA